VTGRKRGGQPGNCNALKHGRRTAQMNALRTEVRFAVLKAKALAKAAWCLDLSGRLPGAYPSGAASASDAEVSGLHLRAGQCKAFGGQAAPQELADGRGAARHVRREPPGIEGLQLGSRQHDLEALLPPVSTHDPNPAQCELLTHNAQKTQLAPMAP
jgi:hypothetical protein